MEPQIKITTILLFKAYILLSFSKVTHFLTSEDLELDSSIQIMVERDDRLSKPSANWSI